MSGEKISQRSGDGIAIDVFHDLITLQKPAILDGNLPK